MTDDTRKFRGERLRDIRLQLGLAQADMALALGYGGKRLTRANLWSGIERGERPIPETVWRLGLAVGMLGKVPEGWLVEPEC